LNLTADLSLSNFKNAWKDASTRLHGIMMEKFILSHLPYMHWNVNTVDTQSTTCFGTQEVADCIHCVHISVPVRLV